MEPVIMFTVYGVAAPKGSTRAFIPKGWKRPIITSDNAKAKPWAQQIAGAALAARGKGDLFEGAVALTAQFYLPRPKSLPRRILQHAKKPDLDKLLRCLKDALTGVIWRDDSQVVRIESVKAYAGGIQDRSTSGVPRVVVAVEDAGFLNLAPGAAPIFDNNDLMPSEPASAREKEPTRRIPPGASND